MQQIQRSGVKTTHMSAQNKYNKFKQSEVGNEHELKLS